MAPDIIVDPSTTCAGIVVTKEVPFEAVSVVVIAIVALPPMVLFGVVCVALLTAAWSELMRDSALCSLDEYGASALAVMKGGGAAAVMRDDTRTLGSPVILAPASATARLGCIDEGKYEAAICWMAESN